MAGITIEMEGTGSIPKPRKGYKLLVTNTGFNWLDGEYNFLGRLGKKDRWYKEPSSFCEGDVYENCTWQLIPILDI